MGIRRAARAHRLLVAAAMVLLWDVGSGNLLHEAVQKGDLEGVRELLEPTLFYGDLFRKKIASR